MSDAGMTPLPEAPLRGYIEGYYGHLFGWQDRHRIIAKLAALGMNAYLYAPKEDPCHRVNWRDPWPEEWISGFTAMCAAATAHVSRRKAPARSGACSSGGTSAAA